MEESSNRNEIRRQELRPDFSANLDILRSLAVLLVLVAHVMGVVDTRHHLESWDDYFLCTGRLGVLLFFVHTTLVLNFTLARIRASGSELFRTFIVRRAFRLYPLSILCVLLVVALSVPCQPLGVPPARPSWGLILTNLTLTTDLFNYPVILAPLWTLPIELQMYVLMPLTFMLLGTSRNPRVALGLWLLSALVGWLQLGLARWLPVIDCGPCFLAGTVAYALSTLYTKRLPSILWMPFLLGVLCGFYVIQQGVPDNFGNMPLQWMFCLVVGLLIPAFHDSRLAIVNCLARLISRYSYGIYLFHCIAIWFGYAVLKDLPEPLQWLVVLASLSVLSIGSYHLLEKPAIDFGAWLTTPSAPIVRPAMVRTSDG
jgi:peptidoglycan/LPS O-acetylase OafA/YrhL